MKKICKQLIFFIFFLSLLSGCFGQHGDSLMESHHENKNYHTSTPVDHESDCCSHSFSSELEKACHQQPLLVASPIFREFTDFLNTKECGNFYTLRIQKIYSLSLSIQQGTKAKAPLLLASRTLFGQKTSFLN